MTNNKLWTATSGSNLRTISVGLFFHIMSENKKG